MLNLQKLLFRVDASTAIGAGHLMRCIALAQSLQRAGGKAVFAVATKLGKLQLRLREEEIETHQLSVAPGSIQDAIETISLARELKATWLIVDGYHFDVRYQQQVKATELKLLFIDDCGDAGHYYADLVLNQNICANESLYQHREPYTQLLLGSRYVLLREEFLQWQAWKWEIPGVARKVLVTLGGSDPENMTFKVIKALQQVEIQDLEVIAIVGGSNPHYEQLQLLMKQSHVSISLKRNVSNMPELMAWADVAIAGGGLTSWELGFMGVPSILIVLAEHQRENVNQLAQRRACLSMNSQGGLSLEEMAQVITFLIRSFTERKAVSYVSRTLFDGFGSSRVLEKMMMPQM